MSSKKWELEFCEVLLAARDYRSFLACFFLKESGWSSPAPLTYGEFALRAGFASKSFMHEVLSGKKRITPTSIGKVAAGLQLRGRWLEYFEAVVGSLETEFQSRTKTHEYFSKRVQALHKLLMPKTTKHFSSEDLITRLCLQTNFSEIYAALGAPAQGASLPEIELRTGLRSATITQVLRLMVENDLVTQSEDGKRFTARYSQLLSSALKDSEVFTASFLRAQRKAAERIKTQADSATSLYNVQTFSVSKSKLEKLRAELATLIENFASEAEDPTGDVVSEVCLSFTSNGT